MVLDIKDQEIEIQRKMYNDRAEYAHQQRQHLAVAQARKEKTLEPMQRLDEYDPPMYAIIEILSDRQLMSVIRREAQNKARMEDAILQSTYFRRHPKRNLEKIKDKKKRYCGQPKGFKCIDVDELFDVLRC